MLILDITLFQAFLDYIFSDITYILLVAYLKVLGYKIYVYILKKDRVTSEKLAPKAQVEILIRYEGNSIYRVYILLKSKKGKGKVICTLYYRFDKSSIIIDSKE